MPANWWDVIVVGGGPAGCAAAVAARRADPAARVLVVDRSDFPRDKVCGDGIAAQAVRALAGLGLEIPALTAGYPARRRLRLRSPGGRTADRLMRDEVYVIPRRVFDDRLLTAARACGVEFRRHTVRSLVQASDGVVLDDELRARVLIGADGAESVVRRSLGIPINHPEHLAVAIRGYAPDLPGQGSAQLITMSRHRWPAYAWSFPIGNGLCNVGYGEVTTTSPVSRALLLDRMSSLLPDLAPQVTGLRGHRLPLSSGRPPISRGRVMLVGDALSLINPLSGEGIFYAVASGAAAGAATAAGQQAAASYRRTLARRLGRHLRHTTGLARLMRWSALIDAGIEAAHRDQGAFDDLVDLALGDGLITGRLVTHLRR